MKCRSVPTICAELAVIYMFFKNIFLVKDTQKTNEIVHGCIEVIYAAFTNLMLSGY